MLISKQDYIIQMFHVYKRFGNRDVINDVSLNIDRNSFIYLTGPSGAGKSTLLKLIYAGESLSRGQIIIDGMNLVRISRKNLFRLRRKIGIIFQDFRLISTRNVYYNVALVLEAKGLPRRYVDHKVRTVLSNVGMAHLLKAYPPSLSGGEQQRVAVARAIAGDPAIIVADEPTGSLDPDSALSILSLLNDYHAKGGTVVLATHDRTIFEGTNRPIVHLKDGQKTSRVEHPSPIGH